MCAHTRGAKHTKHKGGVGPLNGAGKHLRACMRLRRRRVTFSLRYFEIGVCAHGARGKRFN